VVKVGGKVNVNNKIYDYFDGIIAGNPSFYKLGRNKYWECFEGKVCYLYPVLVEI